MISVVEFRPMARNTLRGFATVALPDGMRLHDVAIHTRDGTSWCSPPGRPMLDREGRQMRGQDGKPVYSPTISFTSRADQAAFSGAVIDALKAKHPEVLS